MFLQYSHNQRKRTPPSMTNHSDLHPLNRQNEWQPIKKNSVWVIRSGIPSTFIWCLLRKNKCAPQDNADGDIPLLLIFTVL